jgi:hypothetical protein
VATAQPARRLYTPSAGLVEAVLRASDDPTCMLAFWLVGFEEESPEQSGEICVAELFGNAVGPERSRVRPLRVPGGRRPRSRRVPEVRRGRLDPRIPAPRPVNSPFRDGMPMHPQHRKLGSHIWDASHRTTEGWFPV